MFHFGHDEHRDPARAHEGRVRLHQIARTDAVPPPEFDSQTYDPITELRPVADVGVIQSWAWVPEPVPGQPLDRPFAFAQIVLDGADRPLLHAVAVEAPGQIQCGM